MSLRDQSALNCGMIATGNHGYFDSLRDAPLVWQSVYSYPQSFASMARSQSSQQG